MAVSDRADLVWVQADEMAASVTASEYRGGGLRISQLGQPGGRAARERRRCAGEALLTETDAPAKVTFDPIEHFHMQLSVQAQVMYEVEHPPHGTGRVLRVTRFHPVPICRPPRTTTPRIHEETLRNRGSAVSSGQMIWASISRD